MIKQAQWTVKAFLLMLVKSADDANVTNVSAFLDFYPNTR